MRSGMMRCFAPCRLADALHVNGRSAGAFDLRSHLVQQVGEVGDFGLAGAVPQHGFALGQSGCHEQIFGAGDRDLVEYNFAALEAVGAGFDVSVLLRDFRAQQFQSLDVQIDGAGADGTAARKRDTGPAAPRHQRPQDQRRRAHLLDQFVGGFGSGQIAGANRGAMLRPSVTQFDFGAHGGQQFAGGLDVAHLRNIFQDDGFFSEQGRGHGRQGGVLGAADANCSQQRIAAANYKFVHLEIIAPVNVRELS